MFTMLYNMNTSCNNNPSLLQNNAVNAVDIAKKYIFPKAMYLIEFHLPDSLLIAVTLCVCMVWFYSKLEVGIFRISIRDQLLILI